MEARIVSYDARRNYLALQIEERLKFLPLVMSWWFPGYKPVIMVARLGEHFCLGGIWRSKRMPLAAGPSIFGEQTSVLP
jgi:hypothetical protein